MAAARACARYKQRRELLELATITQLSEAVIYKTQTLLYTNGALHLS